MTLGRLGILVLQLSIILYPCLMTFVCMSNQHIFFLYSHMHRLFWNMWSRKIQNIIPIFCLYRALADYDKDGKLTCDELCVAMHLADVARMGTPLPAVLPPELVPSKSRSGSFSTPAPPTSQGKGFVCIVN